MSHNICLRAVFAGAIVALALQTLLNLLGMGLEMTSFRFDPEVIAKEGLASFVWLIGSSALSMFIGGWVAARAAGGNAGALHGFIAWSTATLVTFLLVGPTAKVLVGGAAAYLVEVFLVSGQLAMNAGGDAAAHIDANAAQAIVKSSQIVGSAAIIIFSAFIFSAITSVLGGICAAKCNKKQ